MLRALVRTATAAAVLSLVLVGAASASPPGSEYTVTPLVSDIPGVARITDPNLVNPVLAKAGVTINGQPVKGAFVLVGTDGHPERGLRPEHRPEIQAMRHHLESGLRVGISLNPILW